MREENQRKIDYFEERKRKMDKKERERETERRTKKEIDR